jgi:hypothetical protein
VRRVVGAFNRSGLRYALTGGVAASYYGRPRTTLDVDVLVVTKESELTRLAKSLTDEGIKAGTRELSRAWKSKYRIATLVDSKSPYRLDMIFTDQRLERIAGLILGARTYYQTPESLILSKLRMIKATLQPEKAATDREDVKAILEAAHVNLVSIRRRARSQGTLELLDELTRDRIS